MMTFFVRPIIRPPANLYKNDGGGGGRGGGVGRLSRKKFEFPPPGGLRYIKWSPWVPKFSLSDISEIFVFQKTEKLRFFKILSSCNFEPL